MPKRKRLVMGPGLAVLAIMALTVTAGVSTARACFMRSPLPVQVWLDHIHVEITNQIAEKTYDCTFKNPNPQAVVGGTCYMELEPGAQVDDMTVTIDGKKMQAEILDVEKANQVFQQIVKEGGSPALLEYYGNQLIQTQVPRVAPGGTVTVKLRYTTVLKNQGGLVRMQMLNTNPKALMQPLKSASVSVNIKSKEPLKNVYSPTHEIKLVEKEGWDICAEWSQDDYLPKHPFVIYYQTADEPVAASVVAHRELGEPGSFMLMLSPTLGQGTGSLSEADILPKDVVFCVDNSGSMLQGGKMEQARAALEYCVKHLRAGDRFNIVDFSTEVRSFHKNGLVEVDDESRAKALRYVEKLHARGGTAIEEALSMSLEHLSGESERLKMIVFATDGLPTIGERDPETILRQVAKKNEQDVRMFVFGEGYDVNTKLLDFLALRHRGEADYILPDEDITQKISHFFDRVGSPVMTNVSIEFEGLEATEVYPKNIPDLFAGEQVILYGRYTGHGTKTVKITGNFADTGKRFEYQLDFPEYSVVDTSSFVPRLWAGRKVDFLLNEIRGQEKADQELVDEVTHLAKRYGIVTPYTSFLMTDDVVSGNEKQLAEGVNELLRRENAAPASADAVRGAKQQATGRDAARKSGSVGALYAAAEAEFGDSKSGNRQARERSVLKAMRHIGSRTFYNRNDDWYDSEFDDAKQGKPKQIDVGSKEYFELLRKHPQIAKYLALENVVVPVDKTWYQFRNVAKR